MAKEVDSRLDAAMQALQASLLVDEAKRQEEGEALAPAIEASATGELVETSQLAAADAALDLATLASASDQAAAAAPSWALIGGAVVVGAAAIVVASDDDDDIEVSGPFEPTDPTVPTNPDEPTVPTGTTDPDEPTVPVEGEVDVSGELGPDGDLADGGTLTGTDGVADVFVIDFGVLGAGDAAKPTSIGQGQNIRIENLNLEDGDVIRFVGTEEFDLGEFFDLVKPTTNPFGEPTTNLNFFNASGDAISVSFTIDQGFDQQLGAQDDLFVNFFDITTA